MSISTNISKFPTGRIIFSPSARIVIGDDEATAALERHECGDWGETDAGAQAHDEESLTRYGYGAYVMSYYRNSRDQKFFVFTSGDRFESVLFLASEMPAHLIPEMFDLPWTGRPIPGDLPPGYREVLDADTGLFTLNPDGQNPSHDH